MATIYLKGLPLLHEKDFDKKVCDLLHSDSCISDRYFIKANYEWLPHEWMKDEYSSLEEANYLVGLEIMSSEWVNKGLCSYIFKVCGLVLDEAYPIKSQEFDKEAWVLLRFEHVLYESIVNNVSPSDDWN